MSRRALIVGLSGPALTSAERRYLERVRPWGVILFHRNVVAPAQVRALVSEIGAAVGSAEVPILIDQEGGRVQRLKPPIWAQYPAHAAIAAVHAKDAGEGIEAARLLGRLIGADLADLGITVDCDPCLDLAVPEAHAVIGDRAFSRHPGIVATLARAKRDGLMDAGVLPVIKHIPGHGRAMADSHFELPVVDVPRAELEESDFAPFRALNDSPLAMTAHVVYPAIDPVEPATTSAPVIRDVIRTAIGFDGALMSDDIGMKALGGPFDERARRAVRAGCDLVLHCSGDMDEMEAAAAGTPELGGEAARRARAAIEARRIARAFDRAAAEDRLAELLDGVGEGARYRRPAAAAVS